MKRLLAPFLFFQAVVLGCNFSIPPVGVAFKNADAVFVARVIDILDIQSPKENYKRDEKRSIYTLEVSSVFKGRVDINTKAYGDFFVPCGKERFLVKGREYIFFAYYRPASKWLKKGDDFVGLPKADDKIITYLGFSTSSSIDFGLFNELGKLAKPYPPLPVK